jgi:hypothetical protein
MMAAACRIARLEEFKDRELLPRESMKEMLLHKIYP